MALTWEEAALPDDERQAVIEQKKDDFKALAEELRDVDNAAFKVLQGKTAFEDRMATAWVGALLMAIVTFFAAVAAICVLLARLVARFGVMAFPIVVPFGMVAEYRQPVMSLWKTVSGAVVTAIMYTLASGLMIRLLSAMLQSTMPLLLVVAIALGLTVALLVKLRAAQVIRTVAGLKIARNLTRDRIRTEDDDSTDVRRRRSAPDEPSGPTVRRENTPAPTLPRPRRSLSFLPDAQLRGEVLAGGRGTGSARARGTTSPHGRGRRQVIDADVVEPQRSSAPDVARGHAGSAGELGPGEQDHSQPGSSAGVAGPADPRPAVWYMGPPGTNAGEPYYLPLDRLTTPHTAPAPVAPSAVRRPHHRARRDRPADHRRVRARPRARSPGATDAAAPAPSPRGALTMPTLDPPGLDWGDDAAPGEARRRRRMAPGVRWRSPRSSPRW